MQAVYCKTQKKAIKSPHKFMKSDVYSNIIKAWTRKIPQ